MNAQDPSSSSSSSSSLVRRQRAGRRRAVTAVFAVMAVATLLSLPGCRCSEPQGRQARPPAAEAPTGPASPSPKALPESVTAATAAPLPAVATDSRAAAAAVSPPKPATWSFAVARPLSKRALPLSSRDLGPLVATARADVRAAFPWPNAPWGAGPIALSDAGHYLIATQVDGSISLRLASQRMTAHLVGRRCTLRADDPGAQAGRPPVNARCDDTLAAWMLAHAAVWATGQISADDRILRFSLRGDGSPRHAPGSGPPAVIIDLVSKRAGLRWSVVMKNGKLHGLQVATRRGDMAVTLVRGGWSFRPPAAHPRPGVDAQENRGPAVQVHATSLPPADKRGPPGLPLRVAKLGMNDLDTVIGAERAAIERAGLMVLGAQQLVGTWDGNAMHLEVIHSPVWGRTTGLAAIGSVQPLARTAVASDRNIGLVLRRAAVKPGRHLLQFGEVSRSSHSHVLWIRPAN